MSRTAISPSQRSSGNSAIGATCWKPAFGTIASSRPKCSIAASTALRLPSRVVRSAACGTPGPVLGGLEVDGEDVEVVVDEALGDRAADAARRPGDDCGS